MLISNGKIGQQGTVTVVLLIFFTNNLLWIPVVRLSEIIEMTSQQK